MSSAHDPAPGDSRADVGVLFVHGIGEHKQGETLVAFGEPTADWLREWLDADGTKRRGRAEIASVQLRSADDPAWAWLDVESTPPGVGDPQPVRERWLLSEAWWGDAVQPPPSLRLLTWLWSRGPLLIFWHVYLLATSQTRDQKAQSASETASPWDVLMSASAFLVAGVTQVAVTIALALWVVPYGPWRSGLTAIVRGLTATLGDSYVLLEHDMQRAALVSRVRSALAWLSLRAHRVAVVAHSQGGAIAHDALLASPPPNVELFVSVGSGLEKLAFLKLVRQSGEGVVAAALVVPSVTLGAAALTAGLRLDAPAVAIIGGALLTTALGAAAVVLARFREYRRTMVENRPRWTLSTGITWVDIHATHDLVPMGSGSVLEGSALATRFRTVNRRSVLADHTAYFDNRGHFQPALWQALATLSLAVWPDAAVENRWRHFQQVHSWHAQALEAAHFALVAAGLAMLAFHRSLVEQWGRMLDRAVAPGSVWGVDAATTAVQAVLQSVGLPAPDRDTVRHTLQGALLLLGALVLWWAVAGALWSAGSVRRWRTLCRRARSFEPSAALAIGRLGQVWTLVVGALPLWLVSLYSAQPTLFTPDSLGAVIRFAFATVLLLFAALLVLLSPVSTAALWEEAGHTFSSVASSLAGVVLIAVLLSAIAFWLWPPLQPYLNEVAVAGFALAQLAWAVFAWRTWRTVLGATVALAAVLAPVVALAVQPSWVPIWCAVTVGFAVVRFVRPAS